MEHVKEIAQGILANKTLQANTANLSNTEPVKTILCPICNKEVSEPENWYSIEMNGACNVCKKKQDVFASFPPKFKNVSFDTYQSKPENKKAFEGLKNFKLKEQNGELVTNGVLLTGSTGTGKTHLLYSFMRQNIIHNKYFYDYIEMLNSIKAEMFEDNGHKTPTLDFLCSSNFLIIDDFGTGKATEWAIEQINYIINQRYINQLLTFISTNLPLDGDNSIKTYFGARVASRLADMTTIYLIKGSDFRIDKK